MRKSSHIVIALLPLFLSAELLCQQAKSGNQTALSRVDGQTASAEGDVVRVDLSARLAQEEADQYKTAAQELLANDRFNELDQMAAAARSSKSRHQGGGWKLHSLYQGVTTPLETGPRDDFAWQAMIAKLQSWKSHKPDSITAQVALGGAYVNYAWEARGKGYADKVSDDNWKLFEQRLELARTTLTEAAALKEKCPEWFWQMQTVALGQGWEREQEFKLFERAIAFEPQYQYYYRAVARYLMPDWYGAVGEDEAFAEKVRARVGGSGGKVLYFEIAAELICGCGPESALQGMSWQKIREGYDELEKRYGTIAIKLNQFAYLAVRNHDRDAAREAFLRIGENWEKPVWRTAKTFDSYKAWAARTDDDLQSAVVKAENNLLTEEGRRYDATIAREFPEKLSGGLQKCVQQNKNDLQAFNLLLLIGNNGSPEKILHNPVTAISACLLAPLRSTTFSAPPRAEYWVKVSLNLQP